MSPEPISLNPECVPECVPSVSQQGPRADARRVCPPSPSPTEGDTLSEPAAVCPATVSHDPPNTARNSGLYINATDCEYCHAWPTIPCPLHRTAADR